MWEENLIQSAGLEHVEAVSLENPRPEYDVTASIFTH